MKFMSDTSLSELVTKIKNGFLPFKTVSTDTGEDSADLDTYKTSGIYVISGDGADEKPGTSKYGYLIVLNNGFFKTAQIWIDRDVDSYYLDFPIYCRQYSSTEWKSWVRYPSCEDIVLLQDGKLNTSDFTTDIIAGILPINKGGTGAITASGALTNLGISTTEYTPTGLNNCTVTGCKVYKTLDRVYLEGYISVLPTSTSPHQIQSAQLPNECYPPANTRGIAYIKGSDNVVSPIALEVTTNGKVVLTGIVGVQSGSSYTRQNIYFSTSYHVDN